MKLFIAGLLVGIIIGAIVGVTVMCCCVVARDSDKDN